MVRPVVPLFSWFAQKEGLTQRHRPPGPRPRACGLLVTPCASAELPGRRPWGSRKARKRCPLNHVPFRPMTWSLQRKLLVEGLPSADTGFIHPRNVRQQPWGVRGQEVSGQTPLPQTWGRGAHATPLALATVSEGPGQIPHY